MPNRIIKESICTSDSVAEMTDFEFRLWIGLITQADDAGRGDARPAIIKGRVFPLRRSITEKAIEDALHSLASKSCISLYTVGGKSYFWFPTWEQHQRVRDIKPKYPSPEEADEKCQPAADCGELRQTAASCGLNPIQSESNPNPNPNPNPGGKRTRFTPPTVEDVISYAKEAGLILSAERFVDYYVSNGWKVGGKTPMKDWKAAVRNWAARDQVPPNRGGHAVKVTAEQQYTQREYKHSDETIDAMMAEFMASAD